MEKKSCDECRFAVFEDTGYSNWTVTGEDFSCAKRLHPEGTFDRFYGENAKLNFATGCSGFVEGDPIRMDVEQDNINDLTTEQREVWDMHQTAA